jgi:transglutaminase-like putative cysteine protease
MTKLLPSVLIALLSFATQDLLSQFKMDFGNITTEQLSNKPYLSDPGADAIIISDIGVATLNYINGFTVELERDVRIRIVNSNGFDYADIEIPFSATDNLTKYRASSFNLRNGEKVETIIPKKSFILEEATKYRKVLKFNFPDVHEGTVIEYSYIVQMKDESIYTLVPWVFQTSIPIVSSSLIVVYPEFFTYKTIISGNPLLVKSDMISRDQFFGGQRTKVRTYTWSAQNVPAISDEPFIKSLRDNQTRLSFELASVSFPNSSFEEISPTYATLTKKLLERDDFGMALKNSSFLKSMAEKVTAGLNDDLSKVKAIHKYVSENILWDGDEDYTSSSTLRKVFNKQKGNSADINMILIGMLRCLNIKADPVILCTRSNGTLNQYSAMLQQFNYLVANVTAGGESYLVDATNPLRPFDLLPFDCLNGSGRQISEFESKFVELKNPEKTGSFLKLDLSFSDDGSVEGDFTKRNGGYLAFNIREQVKLEGEEGYTDIVKDKYSEAMISGFSIRNLSQRDSDITETCKIKLEEGVIVAGDKKLLNPYFSLKSIENPFSSPERSFPVDFGYPGEDNFSLSLIIPDNYSIEELPDNVSYSLGESSAKYVFTCTQKENKLFVNSSLSFDKTMFSPAEYSGLRDFFAKMLQSQTRLIVLKKKI